MADTRHSGRLLFKKAIILLVVTKDYHRIHQAIISIAQNDYIYHE